MNIAIVGGGNRCRLLIDFIKRHDFQELEARVVAIAETGGSDRCRQSEVPSDVFVTSDYHDLLDRDDIDLIVEMSGDKKLYYDILAKKKQTVRAIDAATARLFWEVVRISDMHEKTKQELQKTRGIYSVFINELIHEEVMVIGPSHEILDVNDALLKNHGLKRDEVVGGACYAVSHQRETACDGDAHPCPLEQIYATGKPSQATHVHKDRNGKERIYTLSCYPLYEKGQISAFVEIAKEITQELNIQRAAMEQEKLASVGRLAAGVAHEINNPLTTILTTAMLIQEDLNAGDPVYEDLQMITDETLRCRKIVTGLLDFARQTKPSKRACDINEIVEETLTLIKKQAAFRDVQVTYALSPGLPPVQVDKGQIQQCLINLGLNGIESCDAGGKVSFSTGLDPSGLALEITVQDTGVGIHPDDLDQIFDPFYTTKGDGTGLGLAVTHGFVEQHGGEIHVSSSPGEGTTFTIRLPLDAGNSNGD